MKRKVIFCVWEFDGKGLFDLDCELLLDWWRGSWRFIFWWVLEDGFIVGDIGSNFLLVGKWLNIVGLRLLLVCFFVGDLVCVWYGMNEFWMVGIFGYFMVLDG